MLRIRWADGERAIGPEAQVRTPDEEKQSRVTAALKRMGYQCTGSDSDGWTHWEPAIKVTKTKPSRVCQHPNDRVYSWIAHDGMMVICCLDCRRVIHARGRETA